MVEINGQIYDWLKMYIFSYVIGCTAAALYMTGTLLNKAQWLLDEFDAWLADCVLIFIGYICYSEPRVNSLYLFGDC